MKEKRQKPESVRKKRCGLNGRPAALILALMVMAASVSCTAGCGIRTGEPYGITGTSAGTEDSANSAAADPAVSSGEGTAEENSAEEESGAGSGEEDIGTGLDRQMEAEGVQPGAGLYGAASQETGYYAYSLLDESEKKVYDRMLYAMEKRVRAGFSGDEADEATIDMVFRSICSDHPEVFDVTGYQIGSVNTFFGGTTYTFDANYQMDQAEAEEMRTQVEQCVSSILSGVDPDADSYTKAKFSYDTIINNTVYDSTAENNQNMLSVFMNGRSVCAGYTAALEYMLQRLGIRCGTVSGTASNDGGTEDHAWNIVRMDGAYYYIDVTFGDPVGNDSGYDFGPDYDYFCITTEDLLKNHEIGGDSVAGQDCTATDDNYYHREGKYFTSYDKNQLAGLFQAMRAGGQKTLSIRCADPDLYNEMYADLIGNSAVFDYLPNESEHGYSANDQFCSMEFAIH
jgi:hypothetical protein